MEACHILFILILISICLYPVLSLGEDRDFGVDLQLNLYRLDKVLC